MSLRSIQLGLLFTALFFSSLVFAACPSGASSAVSCRNTETFGDIALIWLNSGDPNRYYIYGSCPAGQSQLCYYLSPPDCPEGQVPIYDETYGGQADIFIGCGEPPTGEEDNNGDGWPDGSDKDKDSDPDQDGVPNETDDDDDGDGIPDGDDENPFSTPIYTEGVDPNSYVPYQQGELFVDEEGNVWEVTQDETCIYGATTTCYLQAYDTGLNDPDTTPGNARQQGTPGQGVTQETGSSTQTNNGVTTDTQTTQSVNPDGSRTTTTTVTETYADGSSSVTTTTETDYRNTMNNGGTRETSTTRDNYDTSGTHTGTDNLGSGTQHYSDVASEEENKSASGGTNCDREPNCSGDPILCAILRQQWLTRCKNSITEEVEEGTTQYADAVTQAIDDGIGQAQDDVINGINDHNDAINLNTDSQDSISSVFGSASCSTLTVSTAHGGFDISCEDTQPIRNLMTFVFAMLAVYHIYNLIRKPVDR